MLEILKILRRAMRALKFDLGISRKMFLHFDGAHFVKVGV